MTNSSTTYDWQSTEPMGTEPSPAARFLLLLIRTYRRLSSGRPSPCRFYPSCSHYGEEAIEVHGAVRGSLFALRRISRCRPLGPHGVDLVPLAKKARSVHS